MPSKDLLLRITGDSSSAERALLRAEMAQRKYDLAIRQAHAEMEADLDRSSKKTIDALANVGKVMVGVGVAAGAGVVAAVNAYAKFDQAMSEVQASTHETAANMNLLRQASLDLGASSVFTATEVAGAASELAKASVSTADILGGGLKASLDLAAAGGLGLAEAAETMATGLSVFNLEGAEASHVSDLLAAGAGKAQGSVSEMGQALNQSALVASQFGLSIDETVGVLSEFAAAGLTGSDAGTSLRTMLLRLANPSVEAADAMRELGVQAYDAAGNMVKPEQLAGQLQSRMSGLDDATRNAALATIFGSDAIRAASILYQDGAKVAGDWVEKVDDTGYAAETARIKMNNLKGDLEKLGGAFDTALIGLGESADGPLRSITQALTNLLDDFNALSPGAKSAVLAVGGVTAAVGILGGAALVVIPKIAATRVALAELGVTAAGTRTALAGVGTGLGVLAAGFIGVDIMNRVDEWRNAIPEMDKLAASLTKLGETGEASGELLDVFGGDLGELVKSLDMSTGGFNGFINKFEGNFKALDRVDDALAEMVASGHAGEAAAAFDEIAEAAAREGIPLSQVVDHLDAYADAAEAAGVPVGNLRQKMLDSADAIRLQRDGMEGVGTEAHATAEEVQELNDQYQTQLENIPELNDEQRILAERLGLTAQNAIDLTDAMAELAFQQDVATQGNVDATRAQSRYEETIDRAQQTFEDYAAAQKEAAEAGEAFAAAIDEGTGSFDLNTESGRAASDALLAIRDSARDASEAIFNQTGNQELANAAIDDGRDALYNAARQYGLTEDAAWLYVDSILAIPKEAVTVATWEDAEARRLAGAYGSYIDWVTRNRTIVIGYDFVGPGPLEGLGYEGSGSQSGSSGVQGAGAPSGEGSRSYGSQSFGEQSFSVPAGRSSGSGRGYDGPPMQVHNYWPPTTPVSEGTDSAHRLAGLVGIL